MQDDLSARRRGIKRIEQQVRHDLHNFTSESQNGSIRLNALGEQRFLASQPAGRKSLILRGAPHSI